MKTIKITQFLLLSMTFNPLICYAMSETEIKEKFDLLTDELTILQEQYEDAEEKANNLMSAGKTCNKGA